MQEVSNQVVIDNLQTEEVQEVIQDGDANAN